MATKTQTKFFKTLASFIFTSINLLTNSHCHAEIPPDKDTEIYCGNLGGLQAKIPTTYIDTIEFDEQINPQKNTGCAINITSLGFFIKSPEMKPIHKAQIKDNHNTKTKTRIISIGLNSNKYYPGNEFLNTQFRTSIELPSKYWFANYKKTTKREFNLDVYRLVGTDPKTGTPYSQKTDASDVFVSKDKNKNTTTYITCHNNVPDPRGILMCKHDWSLEKNGLPIHAYASYPREILGQWNEIQNSATQLILNFTTSAQKK